MNKILKSVTLLLVILFYNNIAFADDLLNCKNNYPNGGLSGYNSKYGGMDYVVLNYSATSPNCKVVNYDIKSSLPKSDKSPNSSECQGGSDLGKVFVHEYYDDYTKTIVRKEYKCQSREVNPKWYCDGVNDGRRSVECSMPPPPPSSCTTCSNDFSKKCNVGDNGGYNNDLNDFNGVAYWTCGTNTGSCDIVQCNIQSPVCSSNIGSCEVGEASGFLSNINSSVSEWNCSLNGIVKKCTKEKPVINGACPSDLKNNYKMSFVESMAYCEIGNLKNIVNVNGDFSWSCEPNPTNHYFYKGYTDDCKVYKNPTCGSSGEMNSCGSNSFLDRENTCSSDVEKYCWTCARNVAGFLDINCIYEKPPQDVAKCGFSNKKVLSNKPTSGLCEVGVVDSAVNLNIASGDYEWSCKRSAQFDWEVDTFDNCSATWIPQCSSITTTFTKQCGGQNINTNFTLPTATSSTQSVSHDAFSCSAINYECQKDIANEKGVWVKVSDNCTACNSCDCTAAAENLPSGTWSPNYNLFRCVDSTGANPNQVCNGKVTPKCGSTIGSCSTGTFSKWTSPLDANTQTWECVNDGLIASCSGTKINVNVSCGTSQNKSYSSASEINTPTERCSVSNSSYSGSVTSSTPTYSSSDFKFKWNCNAPSDTRQIDWSSSVSCSAFRNPVCASITPSQNIACSVGYASGEYAQGGNRYWKCSNGTATVQECRVERPVYPMAVCGTSNGGSFSNPPTSGLCESGASASVVSDVGTGYSWTCTYPSSNKYIGKTSSCQASKDVACFYDSNNFYQWDGVEEMDCIEDTTEFSYNDGTVSLRADIIYSSGSTSCRYGNGYKLRQFSFSAPWSSGHTVYLYNNIQSSYTKGDGSTIIRVKDSGVEIVGFGTIEGGDNRMFGNKYDICLK